MRHLLAGFLALVAGAVLAAPAQAAPSCGDVVTVSVRLQADLVCAPDATGLVIGADGVIVDLGGHSIRGARLAIDATGGFDAVTVRNGSLLDNSLGIRLAGAGGARIARMTIAGGNEAISSTGGAGLRIVSVDACATFNPILLSARATASCATAGRATATTGSPWAPPRACGSSRTRSRTTRGPGSGSARRATRSCAGTWCAPTAAWGSRSAAAARACLVVDNRAVHNAAGLEVEAGATGTRLLFNVASDNDVLAGGSILPRHGIAVYDPSTVLAGNVARRNPDFGIFAPDGAIDRGGNRASGNGAGQCVNVAC